MFTRHCKGLLLVCQGHHAAISGVLKTQQPCAGKVEIIRPDCLVNQIQPDGTVGVDRQRLCRNATKRRTATAFVLVSVGVIANKVFIATLAMRQQRAQVGLGTARHEQRSFLADHRSCKCFQLLHGRIIAPYIVANLGLRHYLPHCRRRSGNGIAAQVDHVKPPLIVRVNAC